MAWLGSLFKDRKDKLVLGRTGRYRFCPRFTISAKVRKFHAYVVGLTGRGKSKFLQNLIVQDVLADRGCAVIDPHGDLVKDVLRDLHSKGYFSSRGILDRFVYLAPRRRDYITPMNVLAKTGDDTETYEIVQRVIGAFMRTWSQTLQEPPRFQQIMRASIATLVETGGTLRDLHRLLTDDEYREQKLECIENEYVAQACRSFFENEFAQWGRDRAVMINSTTNKVTALTDNPSLVHMLGSRKNHVNIRQIMDASRFLFVDLGDCDQETKRLIGSLVVNGFEHAALSRARAPLETRKPYYLYVDEFQDFAAHPGQAQAFSQMLSQVRKFGLHMILANQSIAQLTPGLQTALGNAQTIVSFRISRADAEALAHVLGFVDTRAVKHESQTDTQHPVFSPLSEQWEQIIQQLTTLQVRQAMVKTADDRLAVVWPEIVGGDKVSRSELESLIVSLLKRNSIPFHDEKEKNLTQEISKSTHGDIFTA